MTIKELINKKRGVLEHKRKIKFDMLKHQICFVGPDKKKMNGFDLRWKQKCGFFKEKKTHWTEIKTKKRLDKKWIFGAIIILLVLSFLILIKL